MTETKQMPVEPTKEMLKAASKVFNLGDPDLKAEIYKAMLAAAPATEPSEAPNSAEVTNFNMYTATYEEWKAMTEAKKFWAVWKLNGGGAPQKRHDSFASAEQEAARLARQEGSPYYVLEAVGVVAPVQIPVDYTPLTDQSHD